MKLLYPVAKSCGGREIFNNSRGGFTKKIHANSKEKSINNSRNDDPLPKFMSDNKTMSLEIGLDGDYDFFKQDINLSKYKEPRLNDLKDGKEIRSWVL